MPRPDIRGTGTPGDRTEHVIVEGLPWCLVACELADDARLAAGIVLANHADLETSFASLAPPVYVNWPTTIPGNDGSLNAGFEPV